MERWNGGGQTNSVEGIQENGEGNNAEKRDLTLTGNPKVALEKDSDRGSVAKKAFPYATGTIPVNTAQRMVNQHTRRGMGAAGPGSGIAGENDA